MDLLNEENLHDNSAVFVQFPVHQFHGSSIFTLSPEIKGALLRRALILVGEALRALTNETDLKP